VLPAGHAAGGCASEAEGEVEFFGRECGFDEGLEGCANHTGGGGAVDEGCVGHEEAESTSR
jgi:hypothetical protein